MSKGHDPNLRTLLSWVALILAVFTPAESLAVPKAELSLGEPYCREERFFIDVTLTAMFTEDILAALESGLPATLIFDWQVRRQRSGWWDDEIAAGDIDWRILFDVLEERYDVFDHAGRRIATCRDVGEVELLLCRGRSIALVNLAKLKSRHRYHVEVVARVEPLNLEEIRDLEGWLCGSLHGSGGEDVVSSLSQHVVGILKQIVGLGSRSVWARSETFSIGD